jgi:membrane protein implicated in regulation of membrane protease activity
VRVMGEDWGASLAQSDAPPIEAGASVRVVRVEGLKVLVEPTSDEVGVSRRHK